MLVGEPAPRLLDQLLPFIVQLARDGEFEVFALSLQLALAPPQGELLLARFGELPRLLGQLIAQHGDVLLDPPLGIPDRLLANPLQLRGHPAVGGLLQLAFPRGEIRGKAPLQRLLDVGAKRLRQRDLRMTGRAGDELVGHAPQYAAGCDRGGHRMHRAERERSSRWLFTAGPRIMTRSGGRQPLLQPAPRAESSPRSLASPRNVIA